jgi:asparagine synthase (glutamine-hydrolysing)
MGAIAGLVLPRGLTASATRIDAMLGGMSGRGGVRSCVVRGHVGMGQAARGHAIDRDGMLAVGDVRIDDRLALAQRLDESPSATDLELLVAAYARWGIDCADRVLGDYAAAIWDTVRGRLVLVRDAFGSRTVRYALHDGAFAFATDTPGLRASGVDLGAANRVRVADYLIGDLFEAGDTTSTFLTNVMRVPAGHTLVLEDGRVTTHRWLRLRPSAAPSTEEEAVERFRTTFEHAVADRMTESRTGSMLSGGIDSASIVAIARDRSTDPFPVVSLVAPDERWTPDGRYVASMIAAGGLDATLVRTDALAPHASAVRTFLETTDDPFDVNVATIALVAFHAAARRGLSVVFDGLDGDLMASHGRETVRYALAEGAWLDAWHEARGHARLYRMGFGRVLGRSGVVSGLWHAARPRLPSPVVNEHHRRARARLVRSYLRESPIDPELARSVDWVERAAAVLPLVRGAASPHADHRRAFDSPILPVALERYDRAAGAHGIDVRHPLLDRRLAELCLALPWRMLCQRGVSKRVLRLALADRLPPDVLAPKWDESVAWSTFLGLQGLLREWCLDMLHTGLRVGRGWLRPDHLIGAADALRTSPMNVRPDLWQLVTIVCWLDRAAASQPRISTP